VWPRAARRASVERASTPRRTNEHRALALKFGFFFNASLKCD
jgi:hypothetical protein